MTSGTETFSMSFSSSSSLHAEAPKGDEGTSMSLADSSIGFFSLSASCVVVSASSVVLISVEASMDKSAKGLYTYSQRKLGKCVW